MSHRRKRAEEARRRILESGDQELINRLHLLEASQGGGRLERGGPGLLGTTLAVGSGAYLGSLLAGMTLSAEMQRAFAEVAEDMGISPAELGIGGAAGGAMEGGAEGADGLLDGLDGFLDL